MGEIEVRVVRIYGGRFGEGDTVISKDTVSIGRGRGNQIKYGFPFLSRLHGTIILKKRTFGDKLIYKDHSSYGTTIIHWDKLEAKSKFVHNKEIKIAQGIGFL